MADIAQLGYQVDSSGLVEANQALDKNAESADRAGRATEKFEADYNRMTKAIDDGARSIRDSMGGSSAAIVSELQTLNRTQSQMLGGVTQLLEGLGKLDGRLGTTAAGLREVASESTASAAATSKQAKASEDSAAALAAQDERYRGIAQRALEFAEANRQGNRSERGLADEMRNSQHAFTDRVAIEARMGTERERMARRAAQLQQAEARATAETQKAARATELRELNLRKLTGQIDPTIAKLDRLAAMEEKLERAAKAGALKPEQFAQYQAKIDAARAATLRMGAASDLATQKIGSLNLKSVETQQSIASMTRALVTGQWGEAQASITSLTARTGIMSAAFSAGGVAIMGTAAAAGAVALAYYSAWKEGRDFDRLVISVGGSAGVTTDQLIAQRNEIGRASGAYSEASESLNILIASGRTYGDVLDEMARSSVNMATLTGKSISTTTGEVMSLAEGGSEALVKLNEKYGFLTLSVFRNIEAIREQKGDYKAAEEAISELDIVMADRAANMVESAGYVERAWKKVISDFKLAAQEIKGIGAQGVDAEIGRIETYLRLQGGEGYAADNARKRLLELSLIKAQQEEEAYLAGQRAQYNKDAIAAEAQANRESAGALQAIEGRLAGLDRESAKLAARNKIIEDYNKLSIRDPGNARLFDGSQERLIAAAEKAVDQTWNRKDRSGRGTDPTQSMIQRLERQIALNLEQVEATDKLTATERLLVQVRSDLERAGTKGSAAGRSRVQTLLAEAEASGKAAAAEQQRRRDLAANTALTEQLAQAERLRQQQTDIDLLGISRGADVTEHLRRQLDIQRQYLSEVEKLDRQQRNANSAVSAQEYQIELQLLADSRDRMLAIEGDYQRRRMEMQSDWRNGATRALDDYLSAGRNVAGQFESAFTNAFGGMEDAIAKFASTGKISFSDLVNSIISDLARIAARQMITGLVGNLFGQSWATQNGIGAPIQVGGDIYGKREYGGSVYGGRSYQVGERNKPELLTTPSGQYLIPGDNGRVDPIRAVNGGGGGGSMGTPVVNVNLIGAPEGTTASARPNGSGGFDLEVIVGQLEGRMASNYAQGYGPLYSAVKSRHALKDAV